VCDLNSLLESYNCLEVLKSPDCNLLFRYRLSLGFFILGTLLSGVSALPLQTELSLLARFLGISAPAAYADLHGLRHWIGFVYFGLQQTASRFPFFGYATDWLAFGHFVIAGFFILPFANPMRYRAVLHIGLAACGGVIVVALICGPVRSIPWFWTVIDCGFGIAGAIPLIYCLHLTNKFR
jgi:hypothetical protein